MNTGKMNGILKR